jgi:hypothetical protein
VVGGVVDAVDADGVDTEFRELGDIAGAGLLVGDGVDEFGGAAGLVVDAADVEAGAALHECYRTLEIVEGRMGRGRTIALDGDGLEGRRGRGRSCSEFFCW